MALGVGEGDTGWGLGLEGVKRRERRERGERRECGERRERGELVGLGGLGWWLVFCLAASVYFLGKPDWSSLPTCRQIQFEFASEVLKGGCSHIWGARGRLIFKRRGGKGGHRWVPEAQAIGVEWPRQTSSVLRLTTGL